MIHPAPAHIISSITRYENAAANAARVGNHAAAKHFRSKARNLRSAHAATAMR